MLRTLCAFATLALISGCSSLPISAALDRVKPNMIKSEVLDLAGDPKRTYREHGEDHWIYVYFENNKELSREVVFESGKVAKVTHPRAKANWAKEIESLGASSADAGFKSVDGGK